MNNKKKALLGALLLSASTLTGCRMFNTNGENLTKIEKQAMEDSEYTELSKELLKEVKAKGMNGSIDKYTALKIVEMLNEHYPTAMDYMNEENAKNATENAFQAIKVIMKKNLETTTRPENMINLANYVTKERDRVFLNNSLLASKNAVTELAAGGMLDQRAWAGSNRVANAAVDLLNYEFDTTNDSDFLEMSAGVRLAIQTIFDEANKYVPEEAHIRRMQSEADVREYELYLIYFTNDIEKKVYLPRRTSDNKIEYVYTYPDCREERYTKEEMYALAGISSLEEQKRLGIDAKLYIWQMGIQVEIENRIEDAKNEIRNAKKGFVKEDKTYTYTAWK